MQKLWARLYHAAALSYARKLFRVCGSDSPVKTDRAVDKLCSSPLVDLRFLYIALECRKAQIKKISSEIYIYMFVSVKFNSVSTAFHKPS